MQTELCTICTSLQEINVSGSKKVSDQGMINLFGYAGPDQGAKYLGFFSSRSLKTKEKYNSFAQFVYFLREMCLLFNF